jgi:hypothetical protein
MGEGSWLSMIIYVTIQQIAVTKVKFQHQSSLRSRRRDAEKA